MNEDFSAEIQELYEKWISAPSAAVCTRLADRLRVSGKSDEAIDVAKQGLEEWPDNVALQVVMGRCLLEGGNVEEAEKIFLEVRKKDPFNLVALKGLSTIAMDQEKYSEAESLLEEYLFENPTDEEAENMLEQAKFKSKATPIKESTEEPPSEEEPAAGSEAGSDQAVAEEEEASTDTSEAAETGEGFPQTDRMKSVLEQQEPSEPETREEEEEADEEEEEEEEEEPAETRAPEAAETEREQPLPEPPKAQPTDAPTEERRVVSEPRREPRSLLDLFTEEERAELGLGPYGSTEE